MYFFFSETSPLSLYSLSLSSLAAGGLASACSSLETRPKCTQAHTMNSLSLDSAQRIFIVSLCALSLSALGEMLAVQAYVMAKWLLCCAALGLVGSLAQSTVMLGLFFFVLSLLTVLNVYFFFLFGAIQSLSECNMIKDRYSLFRVALAPRHAYRPLTRAPSASARHQPLPGDARRYRVHGPADAARRVVVRACVQLTAAVEGACSQEGVRR